MIKCKHMLAKIEIYFHLLNNEVSFHTIIVILQPGLYPYLACLLKAAIEIKIRVLSKDISKQLCLNRLCCSFKNPLVTITSLSELYIVT